MRAAEALEGGLNRNSSPQSIAATRDIYDRFLAKFPLLFGYWKKYADLEFSIAGTEAAEMVSPAQAAADVAIADGRTRSMSEAWPASPTLSTFGPTIVASKSRLATIRM